MQGNFENLMLPISKTMRRTRNEKIHMDSYQSRGNIYNMFIQNTWWWVAQSGRLTWNDPHYLMRKIRKNYFHSKQFNATLHQTKIVKPDYGKIAATLKVEQNIMIPVIWLNLAIFFYFWMLQLFFRTHAYLFSPNEGSCYFIST